MILDKEEHRALLIEMLDRMQFVGAVRKLVAELGEAIEKASVVDTGGEDKT
jgi:hypothetical protein